MSLGVALRFLRAGRDGLGLDFMSIVLPLGGSFFRIIFLFFMVLLYGIFPGAVLKTFYQFKAHGAAIPKNIPATFSQSRQKSSLFNENNEPTNSGRCDFKYHICPVNQ